MPGTGRPRDPDIEPRVLDAALDVYARRGWSGLTMHRVAQQAGVGKAALYLRWPDKEELIVAAFIAGSPHFAPGDEDLPPRELLQVIGTQMREQYTGRFGRALVRLAIEADELPGIFERVSRDFYRELEFGVDALDRAGRDLPSVSLIEALGGAILMRALFTARWDDPRAEPPTDAFVEDLSNLLTRA